MGAKRGRVNERTGDGDWNCQTASQPASQPASQRERQSDTISPPLSRLRWGQTQTASGKKDESQSTLPAIRVSLSLSLPLEKSEVNELHSADVLYPSSDQCSGECHKCTICQLWRIIKCSPLHSLRDFVISFTSVHSKKEKAEESEIKTAVSTRRPIQQTERKRGRTTDGWTAVSDAS